MSSILARLRKYAGLNKDKDRCPSNPCITVREAIEVADHVALLERQRDELLAVIEKAYEVATEHDDRLPFDWAVYCEMLHRAITSVKDDPANSVPDPDGWIEWKGGDRPVAGDTLVCVRFACGEQSPLECEANVWCWSHGNCPEYDIIAYRVVKGGAE